MPTITYPCSGDAFVKPRADRFLSMRELGDRLSISLETVNRLSRPGETIFISARIMKSIGVVLDLAPHQVIELMKPVERAEVAK